MIAHHRMVLPVMLLSFAGQVPPAIARGGQSSNDPPWNSEHVSRLPEEIKNALARLCGESAQAAHYFATYSDNSRLINLHFEHFLSAAPHESAHGTFETCEPALKLSVHRGRPEVIGARPPACEQADRAGAG